MDKIAELARLNEQWALWVKEEETEPGKHALSLNSLAQDISAIESEIRDSQGSNLESLKSSRKYSDKEILKAIIEEVYTDGVTDIPEYFHDEEKNILLGKFSDGDAVYDFEIDLETGQISY